MIAAAMRELFVNIVGKNKERVGGAAAESRRGDGGRGGSIRGRAKLNQEHLSKLERVL